MSHDSENQTEALLRKRRRQCLVHRYIYYVRGETLIEDATYDIWERELRALVTAHPDIAARVEFDEDCPSRSVGSSNIWDYPKEIQHLGESLLVYNPSNLEWFAKVLTILEEKEDEQLVVGQQDLFG